MSWESEDEHRRMALGLVIENTLELGDFKCKQRHCRGHIISMWAGIPGSGKLLGLACNTCFSGYELRICFIQSDESSVPNEERIIV